MQRFQRTVVSVCASPSLTDNIFVLFIRLHYFLVRVANICWFSAFYYFDPPHPKTSLLVFFCPTPFISTWALEPSPHPVIILCCVSNLKLPAQFQLQWEEREESIHRLYRQRCLAIPRNHFLSGLWPGPCSCSEEKSLCLPRHFWMIFCFQHCGNSSVSAWFCPSA